MSVGDRGCSVIGRGLQSPRVSGLDFVAKKSSLAISHRRNARGGCAALFGSRFDRHIGETCLLQIAAYLRRIVGENPREGIGHVIGKYILLDAIPYVEQKMSSGLQNALCFTIGRRPVGKEHRAELATNEIEGRVFERQRQSV